MINFKLAQDGTMLCNKSKIAVVHKDENENALVKNLPMDESRCALLANIFVSSGSGKVKAY